MTNLIDQEVLGRLADALEEEFSELMNAYRSGIPQVFDVIDAAIERQDAEEVRREIHGFKSNCRQIGAYKTAERAYLIEEKAKIGDLSGVSDHMLAIREEWGIITTYLQNSAG